MKKLIAVFMLALSLSSFGQIEADFKEIIAKNQDGKGLQNIALTFIETPYVSATLDVNSVEDLVVNFRELDCVTFVETCMALSKTLESDNVDFDNFCNNLQNIRYRDGVIDGYLSRLHYTSDWIFDNVKKNIIKDRTQEIGGIEFPLQLSYMSAHPDNYPRLKNQPYLVDSILKIESEVNKRTYYYIPKGDIKSKESLINDGDIICFTTSIKGLDISHLGIAYRKNGVLTFIHASYTAKRVIVNPESLVDYCAKIKSNNGIMVLSLK